VAAPDGAVFGDAVTPDFADAAASVPSALLSLDPQPASANTPTAHISHTIRFIVVSTEPEDEM
jgi:hypothetical protein